MAYIKLENTFFLHSKATRISQLAELVYMRSLQLSSLNVSDGNIYSKDVELLFIRTSTKVRTQLKVIRELLEVGLWECNFVEFPFHYKIHNYLFYQTSKQEIKSKQLINKENGRKGGLAKASKHSTDSLARSVEQVFGEPLTESVEELVKINSSLEIEIEKEKDKKEKIIKSLPAVKLQAVFPKSSLTWDAYAAAYMQRWKTNPVRNSQVNAQLCKLVDKVGQDAAPCVAAFYVSHNNPFYVSKRHPTNLLLQDAEGLHTQWVTGIKSTTEESRKAERTDDVVNQVARCGIEKREPVDITPQLKELFYENETQH